MSSLSIGRLTLGPPQSWQPIAGDTVQSSGGGIVPGTRTAPGYQVTITTWAADGQTDTVAARLSLRRRLVSLLNNTALKLQAFLFVVYSDDSEQDGWYVPDQASFTDVTSPVGLATGLWQTAGSWYRAGGRRTHKEAREVWMKDLRAGLYARDALGMVYSTDFSSLPALEVSVLPNGSTRPVVAVSGQVLATAPLATGRDGGQCELVAGQSDMTVVAFERSEAALNISDVIVYDRRGQLTAPSAGPDTSWEEVYGADYPWSWV